jgi:hypothetical protein
LWQQWAPGSRSSSAWIHGFDIPRKNAALLSTSPDIGRTQCDNSGDTFTEQWKMKVKEKDGK